MKHIKFLFIVLIQISFLQFAGAQTATDENGRLTSSKPATPAQQEEAIAPHSFGDNDQDIPGDYPRRNSETYIVSEESSNVTDSDEALMVEEVLARLSKLEGEIASLQLLNEQLQVENRTIRKGMSNCCERVEGNDLTVQNSFLLQNAPNPFNQNTNIEFFVPVNSQDVRIEVRDISGHILKTYNVTPESGHGKVTIQSDSFVKGSYIYTLSIGEELIDSKVMILTK